MFLHWLQSYLGQYSALQFLHIHELQVSVLHIFLLFLSEAAAALFSG